MLAATLVITFFLLLSCYWMKKLSALNNTLTIANAKLLGAKKRALHLARTDPLSAMNNRRAFFDKSELLLLTVKREKTPFSVLMLDIDHFNKINDNYGHAAGDRIIKNIAQAIARVKREVDIAARFGGDEFVILSFNTDLYGAAQFADRLRTAIAPSVHSGAADEINITLSIGVFSVAEHSGAYSLEDYIKHADKALYQAKERGRNCVVLSEHGLGSVLTNKHKDQLCAS